MLCLVYLRILILTALCQPSLHLDRVENGRKSFRRDITYARSPKQSSRSYFSDPELEETEDVDSIKKRSFWFRPIAKSQNRRSTFTDKHHYNNEPHSFIRRTVPHHRSVESEEYHTHGRGKSEFGNADYSEPNSNLLERDTKCGRRQSHVKRKSKGQEVFENIEKGKYEMLNSHGSRVESQKENDANRYNPQRGEHAENRFASQKEHPGNKYDVQREHVGNRYDIQKEHGRHENQRDQLADGESEVEVKGLVRKRRLRNERDEEDNLNRGKRKYIESEAFLGGAETIDDGQKLLEDSSRRRKRTDEDEGVRRWKRRRRKKKRRKKKKKNKSKKTTKENSPSDEEDVSSANVNYEALLGSQMELQPQGMEFEEKVGKLDVKQKRFDSVGNMKNREKRQELSRNYLKNRRQVRNENNFKRWRRQTEEDQEEENQWEEQEYSAGNDNTMELNSDTKKKTNFESEEYGNELESNEDENEKPESVEREYRMAASENEMGYRTPLKSSRTAVERSDQKSELLLNDQYPWNEKPFHGKELGIFGSDEKPLSGNLKVIGKEDSDLKRSENTERQHGESWGETKRSRYADNNFGNPIGKANAKDSEKRRWVYINNVYQYPTSRQQGGKKLKTSIKDVRRARRVHRKLPEVKELLSDDDLKKEEAEWDKEYEAEEAEEAYRDHRQAEMKESEEEVQEQEQEQEQEKVEETESEQEMGPETEMEKKKFRENDMKHRGLEKDLEEGKIRASKYQKTSLRRDFNLPTGGENYRSSIHRNVPAQERQVLQQERQVQPQQPPPQPPPAPSNDNDQGIIINSWNVITLFVLGLLVFTLN